MIRGIFIFAANPIICESQDSYYRFACIHKNAISKRIANPSIRIIVNPFANVSHKCESHSEYKIRNGIRNYTNPIANKHLQWYQHQKIRDKNRRIPKMRIVRIIGFVYYANTDFSKVQIFVANLIFYLRKVIIKDRFA